MKTALITGVFGQDGAYLSRYLLNNGYRVYGVAQHRTKDRNLVKLGVRKDVAVIDGDITDPASVETAILAAQPDEIYNLAAQSHVGQSFKIPQQTCSVNYSGYLNILHSARRLKPSCKIYQAGTSEMYGYSARTGEKQNEKTPFQPMSPYAISKVASHWAGVNAWIECNQFVANGILFNHESPLREIGFVTRKIANGVARIAKGEDHVIMLGNTDSSRDWGHAADYVRAMHLMLQEDKPDSYVVSTGRTHTVKDFIRLAFEAIDKKVTIFDNGSHNAWYVGSKIVAIETSEFKRPNDLNYLCGDSTKAKEVLRWQPEVTFEQLVEDMVRSEVYG